jgi:hypothetical protein
MEKKLSTEPPVEKNNFQRVMSFIVCFMLLIAIICFLVKIYSRQSYHNTAAQVSVTRYNNCGVSYLIFHKDNNLQVINFTTDSLKLAEYVDYQQSISDTPYVEK